MQGPESFIAESCIGDPHTSREFEGVGSIGVQWLNARKNKPITTAVEVQLQPRGRSISSWCCCILVAPVKL